MNFLGLHKWAGIFVTILVAIAFTSAPTYAKSSTAKNNDKESSVQSSKSKSDSKKAAKKSSKKPKPKKSKKVKLSEDDPKAITKALLYDKHIFTGVAGQNMIRLLAPLCLTKAEADRFLTAFS